MRWYSLPSAARAAGVSFRRMLDMVHRNQVRARLSGQRYWIADRELRRWKRARAA
jgi:hypothetical protein